MAHSTRSTSQHLFAKAPNVSRPRSSFDRSHTLKTTFDAGYLVPILVDEVLPGDSVNCRLTAFGRLATPIFPIMDNLYLETFFFFVPNRLVWDHWEEFCGMQIDPDPTFSTEYILPKAYPTVNAVIPTGSLGDYMGLPANSTQYGPTKAKVNALPLRGYQLIWNDWFRDQNLQDSIVVSTDDGPDDLDDYDLLKRGKRHDYFTSALPWAQKGPQVELPLGTTAPILSTGQPIQARASTEAGHRDIAAGQLGGSLSTLTLSGYGGTAATTNWGADGFTIASMDVDLASATAATINALRLAATVQQFYEIQARGGTRYIEVVLAHFGAQSPDFRMQRPELLGVGRSYINITPIAQSSETDTTPLGTLAAFGTLTAHGHGFSKSFVEHGYIIGLANVRADITYQQGINRMWTRSTKFDFFWPVFNNIGEQAVLNQEIFASGTIGTGATDDQGVWGYQEYAAEYRYKPSQVTGNFSSNSSTSLDTWHLAQDFSALPPLADAFITEDPPMTRVLAASTYVNDILLDCRFDYKTARVMSLYSVPGIRRL